jgi:hypothetical protein
MWQARVPAWDRSCDAPVTRAVPIPGRCSGGATPTQPMVPGRRAEHRRIHGVCVRAVQQQRPGDLPPGVPRRGFCIGPPAEDQNVARQDHPYSDAPMPCQGIRVHFSGLISEVLKDGERSICWVADKTGKVHSGEGKLLLGHAQQGRTGSGDGRRIVSRSARVRQPISGSGRPRRISVSRRRGGGGRPRGRRNASGSG